MNQTSFDSALAIPLSPNKKNKMAMCDNHRGVKGCQAIRPLGSLNACGGCQSVFYCNAKCQKQDWVNGHSKKCAELAAKRQRQLDKEKRRERKLAKAKKQAMDNNQSFNESFQRILYECSDSSSDEEDELYASKTSMGSKLSHNSSLASPQKGAAADLEMSHGSLDLSNLAGSLSHLDMSGTKKKKKASSSPRKHLTAV